jgi:uncharacterized protein (TIGR02117 family)
MKLRNLGRLLPLLLFVAGCASGVAPVERDTGEPAASIYVISHGWHTGIALARADVPPGRWPEAAHFARTAYLEAGWGDRDFYMAPGFNAWYGFKALFWPTASVVHLAGFDAHPQRAFPASEVVELRVTRRGLDGLIGYLSASFERQGRSEAAPLGPGLYGVASAFYPSREKFHLFKTCNVWTARALRAAGIAIDSGLTTESIMAQARLIAVPTR